jgi:hypothetical protein
MEGLQELQVKAERRVSIKGFPREFVSPHVNMDYFLSDKPILQYSINAHPHDTHLYTYTSTHILLNT